MMPRQVRFLKNLLKLRSKIRRAGQVASAAERAWKATPGQRIGGAILGGAAGAGSLLGLTHLGYSSQGDRSVARRLTHKKEMLKVGGTGLAVGATIGALSGGPSLARMTAYMRRARRLF